MEKEKSLILTDLKENGIHQNYYIERIVSAIKKNSEVLNELTSKELYNILLLGKNTIPIIYLVATYIDELLRKCTYEYNLYDYFSLLLLKQYNHISDKCNNIIKMSILKVFAPKTLFFLNKISKKINYKNHVCAFQFILDELNFLSTEEAAKILIDLCHFGDFKMFLRKNYPTVEFIIKKNLAAFPLANARDMVLGGSIIGKLVRSNHEYIIDEKINMLQNINYTPDKDIRIIGAGSSCLVFKIGTYVLKIGESRINRKIFIHHRILASQERKLHYDANEEALFYTEIMHLAKIDDVTKEERDELVEDLLSQGLIWHDTKLENCGVLYEYDENIPNMKVDYEEVAGHIYNPIQKLEFKKRKRKVVVIDNDAIYLDPKTLWK